MMPVACISLVAIMKVGKILMCKLIIFRYTFEPHVRFWRRSQSQIQWSNLFTLPRGVQLVATLCRVEQKGNGCAWWFVLARWCQIAALGIDTTWNGHSRKRINVRYAMEVTRILHIYIVTAIHKNYPVENPIAEVSQFNLDPMLQVPFWLTTIWNCWFVPTKSNQKATNLITTISWLPSFPLPIIVTLLATR